MLLTHFGGVFWVIMLLWVETGLNHMLSEWFCKILWSLSFLKVSSIVYESAILPPPKLRRPPCFTDGFNNCSCIFLFMSHKCSSVWSGDLILGFTIHNILFQSSSVQCLCSFASVFFFLLASMWLFLGNFARKSSVLKSPLHCWCWHWCLTNTI